MVTLKTPALPEHAANAALLRWTTRRGQAVRKSQVLALLEVDDQLLAIESPAAGVVQALHARKHSPLVPGDALLDLDPQGLSSHATETPQETAMPQTPPSHLPEGNDRVTALLLPQVGNSMEEGTILKWHVQQGEQIEPGQVLYEVETDKATVEIEAEQAGRLARIVVQEDQTAPVKTPVAYLAEKDQDVEALLSQSPVQAKSQEPSVEAPQAPAQAGPEAEVIPILMPQVGNSMEEGTIVKWHVSVGDRVEKGQVLFEVETDKAVVEVESDDAGRLARIVLEEGQTLAVKQPVAYLAENDQDVDAYLSTSGAQAAYEKVAPAQDTSPPVQEQVQVPAKAPATQAPQAQPREPSQRVKASPAARKLAARRSIDLSRLPAGSGPGGRIITDDLPEADAAFRPVEPVGLGETTREPLTRMRRAIGNALQASKQNIPHFYMRLSVDAQELMSFYRRSKQQFQLSLNDVVTASCGLVLGEFPAFRSRIEQDELVTAGTVNIGIAVGLEQGLVVPVVQGVESLSLEELATRTRQVVLSARDGKIEGMGTGAFTISNLGMFGVEEFSAIINPPESAILAVGTAREEVIVENGALRPGRKMTMTLSCDHRVVDGLVAAKFCARLKEILQAPQDYIR